MAIKTLQDWQVRVIQERADLAAKIDNLDWFIRNNEWCGEDIDWPLLSDQLVAMEAYMKALQKRIDSF